MSKQYSTCTSLPCKSYFLTPDGRQSQVHSGARSEHRMKLAVFCEVMPRSVTEARRHFSTTACLHHLHWSCRRQVLCNVSIPLPDYMASHVSIHKSSSSLQENIGSGFITKPNRCTNFTNLFWHETPHLLDGEPSETCGVTCQNKFVKLVHLFGFVIKKFVTMHGHMNVKKKNHIWHQYPPSGIQAKQTL